MTEIEQKLKKGQQVYLVTCCQNKNHFDLSRDHLEELELLCKTCDLEIIDKEIVSIKRIDPGTFITLGRLEEIKEKVTNLEVNAVIFDDEITPSQQRNLVKFLGINVVDRTEIILQVFSKRARTQEAKIQVELARLQYEAPRLKRLWTHLSRQRATAGGGAYLKGEGEKQIEMDRRMLDQKIYKLRKKLKEIKEQRAVRRTARIRSSVPTFALVGYTNAGKSTLMNALCDAKVLVEDKLFATLDTTIRKFALKNLGEILVIDTVGFIRKIPHHLIAAFRSTLEEAVETDILLHVVDASHPLAEEQMETTLQVLAELGAKDKPIITIFNKQDLEEAQKNIAKWKFKYEKSVSISALKKKGFDVLMEKMIEALAKKRKQVILRVPQRDYHQVSQVFEKGYVHHKDYENDDVILRADLPIYLFERLRHYVIFST